MNIKKIITPVGQGCILSDLNAGLVTVVGETFTLFDHRKKILVQKKSETWLIS